MIDAIMRRTFNGRRRGIEFADDQSSTDLMFTHYKATDILCDVAQYAQPYGLKISAEKTEVLTTGGSPATVYLEGM